MGDGIWRGIIPTGLASCDAMENASARKIYSPMRIVECELGGTLEYWSVVVSLRVIE